MNAKETEFMQIEFSNDDRESFESGTVRIRVEVRLDRRVDIDPRNRQLLVDRLHAAIEPFAEYARSLRRQMSNPHHGR